MSDRRFQISPAAQREYRVLGGMRPSGADAVARAALAKAHASRKPAAVHVTHRKVGWAVKTEGRDRAAAVKPTKAKAIDDARKRAASHGARLVEHDMHGRITKNTKPKS